MTNYKYHYTYTSLKIKFNSKTMESVIFSRIFMYKDSWKISFPAL